MAKKQANIGQLAKMRFNSSVENSAKQANDKEVEIKRVLAEKDAKLGSEEKWRRSSLFNSVTHNLQMHSDLQTKHKLDRLEMLKDKIDVQTSLQSKRHMDTNEDFKKRLLHEKIMDVTQNNNAIKEDLFRTTKGF